MSKKDWFLAGLERIGKQAEKKLDETVSARGRKRRDPEDEDAAQPARRGAGQNPEEYPRRRNDDYMDYMEPDWEELDHKADMIVARYAVVSSVWNVLPPPLDVMGVTATFAKMATELAGVYQVIVSAKRARQMGWAIATTTASVLGVAYAGSKLVKYIPGGGWLISLLVQAPIIGAVAWAAGDTLKAYFKQTRRGVEPSLKSLQESFSKTLRIKLKSVKVDENTAPADTPAASANGTSASAASAPAAPAAAAGGTESLEKIAVLHELLRSGAITQAEFDAAKADLLKKL